jgi:hypothetical protein
MLPPGKNSAAPFGEPAAGVGDDQPDATETAALEMLEETAPA